MSQAVPQVRLWQAWAFLLFMTALTALSFATASTVREWIAFAVLLGGVGLGVWMVVVLMRRSRSRRT